MIANAMNPDNNQIPADDGTDPAAAVKPRLDPLAMKPGMTPAVAGATQGYGSDPLGAFGKPMAVTQGPGAANIDHTSLPGAGSFTPPVQQFGLPQGYGDQSGVTPPGLTGGAGAQPPVHQFGLPQGFGGPGGGTPPTTTPGATAAPAGSTLTESAQNLTGGGRPMSASGGASSTFSYTDPTTGQPTQGNLPTGVAGFASAPLIQNQAGGSTTAQATPGNALSGYVSPQGGQFGPNPGTRLDINGIKSILGGAPGQYDALAGQLAASPTLYKQWQGIQNNDPASVAAAMQSGNPQLAGIAKQYAQRNTENSDVAFGPQGQVWRDVLGGTYKATPGQKSPFLSQADLPVMGGTGATPPVQQFGLPEGFGPQGFGGPGSPGGGPTVGGTAPMAVGGAPQGAAANSGAPPPPQNAGVGTGTGNYATTMANALTNQTLGTPAQNDPYKIAQDQWANFQAATNPQYEASLRDANRMAAAGGALGSGHLQTSIGDLANQRALALDTQKNQLLSNALGLQNENAYRNVGISQQQQGFQQGQQQSAFGQGMMGTQLQDQLRNSAFGRALQQQMAGSQGNPAAIQMMLSQIFGQQATGAGTALSQMLAGNQANKTSQQSNNTLLQYLQSRMGGNAAGSQPPPNPTFNPINPGYTPNLGIGG